MNKLNLTYNIISFYILKNTAIAKSDGTKIEPPRFLANAHHTQDRDVNSAQVCLAWARGFERASLQTVDESSSTESPKVKYCGGFQQLAQIIRYKIIYINNNNNKNIMLER